MNLMNRALIGNVPLLIAFSYGMILNSSGNNIFAEVECPREILFAVVPYRSRKI